MYRCQRCSSIEGPRKQRRIVYIYREKRTEVGGQSSSRLEIEREIQLCHDCYDKAGKLYQTVRRA